MSALAGAGEPRPEKKAKTNRNWYTAFVARFCFDSLPRVPVKGGAIPMDHEATPTETYEERFRRVSALNAAYREKRRLGLLPLIHIHWVDPNQVGYWYPPEPEPEKPRRFSEWFEAHRVRPKS